jgi:hypothetical protein
MPDVRREILSLPQPFLLAKQITFPITVFQTLEIAHNAGLAQKQP